MTDSYSIEQSDLVERWMMVRKPGERTQHFRTREEAERYVESPAYRDQVIGRSQPEPELLVTLEAEPETRPTLELDKEDREYSDLIEPSGSDIPEDQTQFE